MLIRRERPGDEAAVHRVHARAFEPAQGGGESDPVVEAVLVDRLREDGSAWIGRLSLVAEAEDGERIGHLVCTRAYLRGDVPVLGLGPVGVLPRHQRRGVGTALVHAVCAAADALDEPLVVLLGDPAFYRRCGFVLAARHAITPPQAGWASHFQVRTLTGFDPAVHHGGFRYAAAFDDV